jgi:hypothetical protein
VALYKLFFKINVVLARRQDNKPTHPLVIILGLRLLE